MGTVPPKELLKKWECEEITIEMAIGHILQNLVQRRAFADAGLAKPSSIINQLRRHNNFQ